MTNRTPPNPARAPRTARKTPQGHDVRSLGPSDSSDSGSDLADAGASIGDLGMDDTSDRSGTGERLAAGKEPDVRVGGDIGFDRVVGAGEAGLGGGMDEAEEARAGVTDEELAARSRARPQRRR